MKTMAREPTEDIGRDEGIRELDDLLSQIRTEIDKGLDQVRRRAIERMNRDEHRESGGD